ncbi:MAG: hypothetical protein SNJ64_00180 [Endomicrobiia bacterium]
MTGEFMDYNPYQQLVNFDINNMTNLGKVKQNTPYVQPIKQVNPYSVKIDTKQQQLDSELKNINSALEELRKRVKETVVDPFDTSSVADLEKQQEEYRKLLEKRLNIQKDLQAIKSNNAYGYSVSIVDEELNKAIDREKALESQQNFVYRDTETKKTYNDYVEALRDKLRQKIGG